VYCGWRGVVCFCVFLCTWVLEQVTDLVIVLRSVRAEALLVSGCRMCVFISVLLSVIMVCCLDTVFSVLY
jgi:hypothetical protein